VPIRITWSPYWQDYITTTETHTGTHAKPSDNHRVPSSHRFGGGRPRVPARRGAAALFSVLRTGCPWGARQQPECCAHSPPHDRGQVWAAADVFLHRWPAGGAQVDALQGLAWHGLSLDGALPKAPLGGDKNWSQAHRSRPRRGQALAVDCGPGHPDGPGAGANRHNLPRVRATRDSLVVQRPPPPQAPPQGRGRDTGADEQDGRESVAEVGVTAQRRARGEAAQAIKKPAGQRARRWVVERTQAWRSRVRRSLGRWAKKLEHSLACRHFACALIAFRAAGLFG
jgi:transposase